MKKVDFQQKHMWVECTDGELLHITTQKIQIPIQSFKWVGWWKSEDSAINLNSIGFLHAFKRIRGKIVVFGNEELAYTLKLNTQNASALCSLIEESNPVYLQAETSLHEVSSIQRLFFKERLWINPNYVSYVRRKMFDKFQIDIVKIPDIAFYNQSGILFKKLYFGYIDQIEIALPEHAFTQYLEEYLKNHGAKIGINVNNIYTGKFRFSKFYNPKYWFYRETLSLTDNAILYSLKTFTGRDTIYLPYAQISLAVPTKGVFRKRITILGNMHIITKTSFDKRVVEQIMNNLSAHGINSIAKGNVYEPSLLWFEWLKNIFSPAVQLIVGEENLYVTKGRLGGLYRGVTFGNDVSTEIVNEFFKDNKSRKNTSFTLIRKTDIKKGEFNKAHFWNLTGTLVLTFESHSIRKDQNTESAGIVIATNMKKAQVQALADELGISLN